MKAAIIQHEQSTPPGTTIDWLLKRNIPFDLYKLFETPTLPQIQDFDLLFICGGSMNVDEEGKFPWLKTEKSLIQQAIDKNKFLVGLCLGGQLLAEALGANVQRHRFTEVGWHRVQFQPNNFFRLSKELDAFQWHSYTFDIPVGAHLLASNQACQNQAFAYQNNVLGFQFHPESSKDWVIECANDPNLPSGPYCQKREEIIKDLALQGALQKWYFDILDQHLANWQD